MYELFLKYLVDCCCHLEALGLGEKPLFSHMVEKWKICLSGCNFWYFNVLWSLPITYVEILRELVKSWWRNLDSQFWNFLKYHYYQNFSFCVQRVLDIINFSDDSTYLMYLFPVFTSLWFALLSTNFSLLWLKSQNVGVLHTMRIHSYFCHLHLLWAKPTTITKYFISIRLVHREISCERWKLGFGIFHIPTAMWSGRAQALLRVFHTVA